MTQERVVAAYLVETPYSLDRAAEVIAGELVLATALNRVIFAGGDTSGYAVKELGIYALEVKAQLTRGAPLCRCFSEDPRLDGLEVLLKGGQVGETAYFGSLLS